MITCHLISIYNISYIFSLKISSITVVGVVIIHRDNHLPLSAISDIFIAANRTKKKSYTRKHWSSKPATPNHRHASDFRVAVAFRNGKYVIELALDSLMPNFITRRKS